MKTTEMIQFCRDQEAKALKLEYERRGMAASWLTGTTEGWHEAARGAGCAYIPRKSRVQLSDIDLRIATKHAKEAAMYAAIAVALEPTK